MICSKCRTDAELKIFSSFSYWYCTSCKDEASAELVSDVVEISEDLAKFFDDGYIDIVGMNND